MKEVKMKITAAFVAFTMIAVAFAVVYVEEGSAEDNVDFSALDVQSNAAPTAYGEFNIYIGLGNSNWWTFHQEGYNAAISIDKIGLVGLNLDMDYTIDMGGWYDINPTYGQISMPATINGTQYTNLSVYYYNEQSATWVNASTQTLSLGFYKPFADYELKTANIALYFTSGMSIKPTMPSSSTLQPLVPMSDIINNPDFMVAFNFSANLDLLDMNYPGAPGHNAQIQYLANGYGPVYGYGSDTYLALKYIATAIGLQLSGQSNVIDTNQSNNVNRSYGSVQDLLGLVYGAPPNYDTYYYWALYYDDDFTEYAGWILGFLSPLDEASELGNDPISLYPPYSYPTPSGTFVLNEIWMRYTA